MMSNSESRKREAERAAGELVADVDTLAGFIARHVDNDPDSYTDDPRELAEALVAAGFGRIDAARREIAQAERRGAEAVLVAVAAVPSKRFGSLSDDWMRVRDVLNAAREAARNAGTS